MGVNGENSIACLRKGNLGFRRPQMLIIAGPKCIYIDFIIISFVFIATSSMISFAHLRRSKTWRSKMERHASQTKSSYLIKPHPCALSATLFFMTVRKEIRWFVCLFIDWLIYLFIDLVFLFIYLCTVLFVFWLIDWLIFLFIDLLSFLYLIIYIFVEEIVGNNWTRTSKLQLPLYCTWKVASLPCPQRQCPTCKRVSLEHQARKFNKTFFGAYGVTKCIVIPPNSNTFPDWRRMCHVPLVKNQWRPRANKTQRRPRETTTWPLDSHVITLCTLKPREICVPVGLM